MASPVEITVYSDYLCPWCWPAALNLKRLREEFGEAVRIVHKAFLLRPGDEKREFSAYHLQHRVAAERATGLPFTVPRVGDPYPRGSTFALEAAKWVAAHHADKAEAFDLALFRAFFQCVADVSSPAILAKLANDLGMDGAALVQSLTAKTYRAAVQADHDEAIALGVNSIPAVFIGSSSVSGAAPYEEYANTLRDELASVSSPGGAAPRRARAARTPAARAGQPRRGAAA